MLKCKDVHHLVSTGHADDMSWMEKMNMKMHLLMCRHCRNYVEQMQAIGDTVRSLWSEHAQKTESEERLEREILAEIGSSNDRKDPG